VKGGVYMAGWTTVRNLLDIELVQRRDEGCDITGYAQKLAETEDNLEELNAIYDEIMELEPDKTLLQNEPNELEEIRKEAPDGVVWNKKNEEIDLDLFYGAWLGRCCGCALGKPVENSPFMAGKDGIPGWKLVYEWFAKAGAYPIEGYVPTVSKAQEEYNITIASYGQDSLREKIRFMETDDDIRYTVLGLILTEEKGIEFDTFNVGKLWHDYLPYSMVCTAEKQAYLNFCQSLDLLPEDANEKQKTKFIDWVRTYRNPYREWIGAQIRVDGYAYSVAGNPELAAELAWRDASLSHVRSGIYGAMFVSAMIAAAFVEKDNMKIIEVGLAQIPENSRLAKDIKKAIQITKTAKNQLDLVEKIWEAFKHYDPVHTNNNAALCAAAVLFAGDDFEKGITTAVLGGWDTDCNGATVGSIMGAKLGANAIPERWKEPLKDTLYSAIPGFHPIGISECAERSRKVYLRTKER
jgi:ADP-ribosylglycohydrolase